MRNTVTNANESYAEIEDLLLNIVCKEVKKSKEHATPDTDFLFAKYSAAVKQKDFLTDYEIPLKLFLELIPRIPPSLAELIISGVEDYAKHLTDKEIALLLLHLRDDRINTYVEQNNYYRMLMGLPPTEDGPEDFVYYKGHPLHKLPIDLYFEAKRSGYLNVKINEFPEKRYLWYIGKHIDNIHAHEAGQFDILWTKEGSKYNKYRECFNKERDVFLNTVHSDFLCETTDYAEARELVTIKLQAILIYKLEINSAELDKAEFTVEEATRIWKEYGYTFPKNMIESYRNTTTFLLSYLNSMKGTNKVMTYISEKLFTGIKLYKYWVKKTHKTGVKFPLPEGTDPLDFYNIEFVLRPYYSTNITDYKENDLDDKILSYDEVVAMDPRWRNSAELKKHIFSSDFSYTESKYLSLDNFIDLSEFTNTFSVLTRVLIEHRESIQNEKILIPSIGYKISIFSALVYYLALITKFTEARDVPIPDSVEDGIRLLGFKIPSNINELRVKFAWFFAKSNLSWLLDEFPDAIDTNGSFFNFVVHTDKVIGLDSYMYDLLAECDNWPEYDLASSIFDMVKLVRKSPDSYGLSATPLGMTYQNWLLKNEPGAFEAYSKVTADKETFVVEFDTLTQALINFFEDATMPEHNPKNIVSVISSFSIMANGVSKYLLYVLNMFKSFKCEFLNESVAYYFDEKYNVLKQIDNIRIDGHYDNHFYMNNSDYDNVIIQRRDTTIINDMLVQEDGIYMCTPTGTIRINNQGG